MAKKRKKRAARRGGGGAGAAEDCEYLLKQSENSLEKIARYIFYSYAAGLALAFASTALNLGALEIKHLTIKDNEFVFTNAVFLRLFLTCASVASIVAILNFRAAEDRHENLVRYLSAVKRYKKAMLMSDFLVWYKRTSDFKFNDSVSTLVAVSVLVLMGVLPVLTFLISIYAPVSTFLTSLFGR